MQTELCSTWIRTTHILQAQKSPKLMEKILMAITRDYLRMGLPERNAKLVAGKELANRIEVASMTMQDLTADFPHKKYSGPRFTRKTILITPKKRYPRKEYRYER